MSDVVEHGIRFCHIPPGPFLMGSAEGDPDEQPVHEVDVGEFWLSETAISWFDFARLTGWSEPPDCFPPEKERERLDRKAVFHLYEENKIRRQYCEDKTLRATDWHAHSNSGPSIFGKPLREDDDTAFTYAQKPMVAVSWQDAEELCTRLSTPAITYRLPTEAEWEKAARGNLVGCRFSWGNDPPTPDRCDFNRFDEFSIKPSRTYPPNGYGLYGICGSVWEWTSDIYDALAYSKAPIPKQALSPEEKMSASRPSTLGRLLGVLGINKQETKQPCPTTQLQRVLRGGSWADCAEAITVSFRMSCGSTSWRSATWAEHLAPNIGFRICRVATGK
jgi:formylglycine-generating enzyme required for sulfatase activity